MGADMKKLNRKSIGLLVAVPMFALMVLMNTSCGIDDSINNSPNAINEAKVKSATGVRGLMISLQVAVADFYSGDRSRIGSMWARQMCAPSGLGRPQPVSWNSYQMQTDGFVDDMWKLGYRGVRIANDIIAYSPDIQFGDNNAALQNTFIGIAKTYKALILGELAAYYGSIPVDITGLEAATFVSQEVAYQKVQTLLDEALVSFASTGAVPHDLNFGGDGAKWTKVVHSLKARYYLHAQDYPKAATEAALGISDATGNIFGIYNEAAGEYSTWGHWALTEVGEPIRATNTFIRALKAEGTDSRLAEYFNPNDEDVYVGFAYFKKDDATPAELDITKLSTLKKYGKYADDFPLITYKETILILAEAQARTSKPGEALTNLDLIRTAAGLSGYTGTDLIGEILNQKYLQLFLEGQAYTDMRRTNTKPDPNMPMRFIYPITEKNANPNVPNDSPQLVMWGR